MRAPACQRPAHVATSYSRRAKRLWLLSGSLTDSKQSVQDYNLILHQMANKGASLWFGTRASGQYPAPTAVVGNSDTDSVFELSSIIKDTRFDLDDQLIDSSAYRRALASLIQAQASSNRFDGEVAAPLERWMAMSEASGASHGDNTGVELATETRAGIDPRQMSLRGSK